jgi:crossover junction endodeoxyribonuclease RusA
MSPITLTFTYPPSANRMWRNFRGRTVKSQEYGDWLDLNTVLTLQERFKEVKGHFRLTILAKAPDKRRRDLDNLAKPIGDLLQRVAAISDDCNCRELRMAWIEGPGAGVTVTVEPLT